jgi:hypothetical protein
MSKVIGLFRRSHPEKPWGRIMQIAEHKHLVAYQQLYPMDELALFEYEYSYSIVTWNTDTMKRIM